jgi:hypothetical protein
VGGSEFRATLSEAARLAQETDDTERLVTAALANYPALARCVSLALAKTNAGTFP